MPTTLCDELCVEGNSKSTASSDYELLVVSIAILAVHQPFCVAKDCIATAALELLLLVYLSSSYDAPWLPYVIVSTNMLKFCNKNGSTYAPELTVLLNVLLRQGSHLLVDEYLIHLWSVYEPYYTLSES